MPLFHGFVDGIWELIAFCTISIHVLFSISVTENYHERVYRAHACLAWYLYLPYDWWPLARKYFPPNGPVSHTHYNHPSNRLNALLNYPVPN